MNRCVYVYGIASEEEILTTWMVNNRRPNITLADGTSIGNADLAMLPYAVAATASKKLPINHLELTRIVSDAECRELYRKRYP